MKILIIGFAKIKYMPYLNLYLENLNTKDNEVHLVYWNRDEEQEDLNAVQSLKLHEFKCNQEDEVAKISKVKNFLKFKKYVKSILKDRFDFVIVLQTVTAVLLFDILMTKRFKGKYIFDYRDCTYENIKPYKYLVGRLVENSRVTFVSSPGFLKNLPESKKIKCVHNVLSEDLKFSQNGSLNRTSSEKIRIGYWGFLREENVNLEIIKKISKDQRFELHYYGREQKTAYNLKDYVSKNQIKNVFFHGEYNPEEKYEFLKNTDIIHNIYCEDSMLTAISNKFYDGLIFETPQVCMVGSYMGGLVQKINIGVVLNPETEDFLDSLYEYCNSVDTVEFKNNCFVRRSEIKKEQDEASNMLKTL